MKCNLGSPVNTSQSWQGEPSVSADGLSLYFASDRPGGSGGSDLWVTTRQKKDDEWATPVNLGPIINSSAHESSPCISTDYLELYFCSRRSGHWSLYVAKRSTKNDEWNSPSILPTTSGSGVSRHEWPSISANGLELYSSAYNYNGQGYYDVFVTKRTSHNDIWGEPLRLGQNVNSTSLNEITPDISADGLVLIYSKGHGASTYHLWMTTRKNTSGPWEPSVNLDAIFGSKGTSTNWNPSISNDGSILYFESDRPGSFGGADIWQVQIEPVVDINGDGIVDAADLCIVVDYWGTDESLCDIGPMPWGDGVVNVEDMKVLAKHLFEDYRLIAHWELDETTGNMAYDEIGNNDATVHGEPLWVPDGGKIGGALQFDGIDDYVSMPSVLNPGDGSLSVFAWIKGGTPGQAILSQANSTFGSNSTWLGMDSSDGKLITRLMHPPFPPLESQCIITDGQWHHVGLVYDRSSLQRGLYVDGDEVAKDIGPVPAIGSNGNLYIGTDEVLEDTSFFSGLIDDVRIYNNVLSEEEIAGLAQ